MTLADSVINYFTPYKIYCDMDGVISDFDAQLIPFGFDKEWNPRKWDVIKTINRFWHDMPWTSDGKELWNYIKKHDPTILTAPSYDSQCKPGKLAWVRREIGTAKVVFSPAKEKCNYAEENAILIDDLEDNVKRWVDNGGIGIVHKNTADTIKQLKVLGL